MKEATYSIAESATGRLRIGRKSIVLSSVVLASMAAVACRGENNPVNLLTAVSTPTVAAQQTPEVAGNDLDRVDGQSTPLQFGERIPEISLLSLDGEIVNLKEFAGSPLIIFLWEEGCPPCEAELENINKVQQRFSQSDLKIISVLARPPAREFHDNFRTLISNEQFEAVFGIPYYPIVYMMDEDGIYVNKLTGKGLYLRLENATGALISRQRVTPSDEIKLDADLMEIPLSSEDIGVGTLFSAARAFAQNPNVSQDVSQYVLAQIDEIRGPAGTMSEPKKAGYFTQNAGGAALALSQYYCGEGNYQEVFDMLQKLAEFTLSFYTKYARAYILSVSDWPQLASKFNLGCQLEHFPTEN